MNDLNTDFKALRAEATAFRDAAIADMETVSAAAEALGSTLQSALLFEPLSMTSFVEGLSEAVLSAQALTATLQTGLSFDTSALGEDGLLGLLDEIASRTEGVAEFFESIATHASEAGGLLGVTGEALGYLFDLSGQKGIEQTDFILEQLGIRQGFLDENRLLETGSQLLAQDERFAGLQGFLTDSLGIQTQGLTDEGSLQATFQSANLTGLLGFANAALGIKTGEVNASLGLEAQGQKAQGEVISEGLNDKLGMASKVFGGLSTLMESENKNLFEIGKAAAIAEVGVNTALGAIKAYQSMVGIDYVGPVLGPVAAASVVAAGAKSISEISSKRPGSGGKSSVSFTPVRPSAGGGVPRISAPALPAVAGLAGAGMNGGMSKEIQVHINEKSILDLVANASTKGQLIIDKMAISK